MGTLVSREGTPPPRATVALAEGTRPHPQRAVADAVSRRGPVPAARDLRALVAPLDVGSGLDGWTVKQIWTLRDGVLPIELTRGSSVLTLIVARHAPGAVPPVATAADLAVYYFGHEVAVEDAQRVALALGRVLQRHAGQPLPDGLRPFLPDRGR